MPRTKKTVSDGVAKDTIPQAENDTANVPIGAGLCPDLTEDTEAQRSGTEAAPYTEKPKEGEVEALRRELAALKAKMAPEEVVELTFLAPVSPDNVCSLGDYGSLNGVGGYIEIPRKEFGGKFMTQEVRSLLKDRSLIVCSGLNEEERRRYGVDYREGELLDMSTFDRLLDMPLDELKTLFSKLCPDHKKFVATRFITAYEKGDNRVSRQKIEPLNDLSKEIEPKGLFKPILDGMNKA